MNLIDYSFKNKALIYFLVVVMVGGGIGAYQTMSKLEDPAVKVKQALIITPYPGASAEQVEKEVTDVMEESILTMGDLDEVTSRSMPNMSEVKVKLHTTVRTAEVDQYWDILRRKVRDVHDALPENAGLPIIIDDFGDVYGIFLAVTADGFDHEEHWDWARYIKTELRSVAEVKRVKLYGKREPVIKVEISEEKMANLGVHPLQVVRTLSQQDTPVYPGSFKAGQKRLRIEVGGAFTRVEDIRELLIQGTQGDQLKLSDIATIRQGYKEPYTRVMYHEGMQSLGIAISMKEGGNIIDLGFRVQKKLEELKEIVPAGIEFHTVFDQPAEVEEAIDSFMLNLVMSVVIVIAVLMLTMGLRSGLLVGSGLVFTIAGTVLILGGLNGTLQRVSLSAFIVAMGMLVDNSIVVVDGMLVDLQQGLERRKAYTRFAKKTALPLLGATAIAIAAFFPIFLSPDVTGEYTADLFVVLAISLTLSWILALTQVPVFAASVFRRYKSDQNKEAHSHFIHRQFRGLVKMAMRHRLITVVLVLVLLGSTIWGFQFVRNSFFPDLPYNQIYMVYELPSGSDTERVISDLEEVESYLEKIPDVTAVTRSVGATPARYILLRTIAEPRMGYGELIITLTDFEAVQKWAPVIQAEVSRRHPDAYVRVKRYNFVVETTHPVEVMYTGPDADVLRSLAEKTVNIIAAEPKARLVKSDWFPKELKLQVDYNQAAARRAEISRPAVSNAMLMATEGMPIGVYYDGLEDYPIMVHMVDRAGEPVNDLRGIPVWGLSPRGDLNITLLQQVMRGATSITEIIKQSMGSIPLGQVADSIRLEWEEKLIRRHNGKRAIMVKSETRPGFLPAEVLAAVREEVEAIELPTGYTRQWRGEHMTKNESLRYLSLNLPLALFIMAGVLIMLFRNIRNPLIIFLCLPLAAIGIVWGLVFTGRELGFVAIVGAIGLMGMMIKNGVVLLDDIEDRINNGDSRFASVVESAVARMRPVMMASMTTILGMIPLLWDAMFASLAVTIMSGLLVGTLITLVIMPVLYSLFFGIEIPRKANATESRNNA